MGRDPAGVLQGDLAGGGEARDEAGGPQAVAGPGPGELAVQEAAGQGVRQDAGAGDAAPGGVGAAERARLLLVIQPPPLDAVHRPRGAARRRLALLYLEVLLPDRVCARRRMPVQSVLLALLLCRMGGKGGMGGGGGGAEIKEKKITWPWSLWNPAQ